MVLQMEIFDDKYFITYTNITQILGLYEEYHMASTGILLVHL